MKFLLTCWLLLFLLSCKTKRNAVDSGPPVSVSQPSDSLRLYFPKDIFYSQPESDSFIQNWFSSALYSFKEPVLSQSYTGEPVYRFLWLRSFDRPVVFTLRKWEGEIWFTVKMLNKQPLFEDNRIGGILPAEQESYRKEGFVADTSEPDMMVLKADRRATIIYQKDSLLSQEHWTTFENLIDSVHFRELPSRINDGSTDGAEWVIEMAINGQYHVVDYHGPDGHFKTAGLYLIRLSGLKERIY